MIIVTGVAGFIGSCMVSKLNQEGFRELILVDDFSKKGKHSNFEGKQYTACVERKEFFEWAKGKEAGFQCIIHLGARTDTTEQEKEIFDHLNLNYSKEVWRLCTDHHIPLIYASSAATYGDGSQGFSDNHAGLQSLQPLNPYGNSKHHFDLWALAQEKSPFFWLGLKFFNVYGPNEYHKGRMASVIFHTYQQILKTTHMRLFRSHREDYADGEQKRDFIYVKDVIDVIYYFMTHRKGSGIYNLGTGKARTFNDLAIAVFKAMKKKPAIDYIDTPVDIRDSYQYFTEAKMEKLRGQGYTSPFYELEDGIMDYVQQYLQHRQKKNGLF